uniref:RNA-directed RNA polymerase n=1 Tax=Shahe levi-like virus 1 TaxID=1923426 RepID=A0A1L3KID7_9VIRU|nr:hypothetical protein [Shahe levi-like virus 1]
MTNPSLPKAFAKVISNFLNIERDNLQFDESFALNRARRKWQEPSSNTVSVLSQKCWEDWSTYDQTVILDPKRVFTLFQERPLFWYKVQQCLSGIHYDARLGGLSFSAGSSFTTSGGRNSIEEKLQFSQWDITHDCFEPFLNLVLANRCLRTALKFRFRALLSAGPAVLIHIPHRVMSKSDKIYVSVDPAHFFSKEFFGRCGNDASNILRIMLFNVVTFQCGSRFSSVPKNNSVRRPINIEPLCNMIVQKCVGNCVRSFLRTSFGVDLDTLADSHRLRISQGDVATIDLKNASDSISIGLCKWLLPPRLFKIMMNSRSHYIKHDEDWFYINKISAMGNGFTFEIMSAILTAIGRQLDPTCTVFGDDIIISNDAAPDMVRSIESVGFRVNPEKTFINSPFRESCGGNFHDHFGYIRSFDFVWPVVDHDCVVLYNKVAALPYPSFRELEQQLRRLIPKALRGPRDSFRTALEYLGASTFAENETNPHLSTYFRCGDMVVSRVPSGDIIEALDKIHIKGTPLIFTGFTSKVEEVGRQIYNVIPTRHFGKLFMYLHANGRCRNAISFSTSWTHCALVFVDGRVFRLRNLLSATA